jgi:hypothetical protein
MKLLRNKIQTMGRGLAKLYSWNQAVDVEAQQVLLCIRALSDENGYAQVAEVRKTVGIAPDRMTRCMRMLQGYNKGQSIFKGLITKRQPLIDLTTYIDSPSVGRIGLTDRGFEIVEELVGSCHRIVELEDLLEKQNRIIQTFTKMGFDIEKIDLASKSTELSFWDDRVNCLFNKLLEDLSNKTPEELLELDLPILTEVLKSRDPTGNIQVDEAFVKQWGFTLIGMQQRLN